MEHKTARKQKRAPTISDVAREAGVSPMTVSRVINGEANVRDATRDIVNAAIAALHYAPNPAARSLAGSDPIRIGLLYSNPSAAYLSEFLVGGLDQASRSNIQLVVEQVPGDDGGEEAIRHIIKGKVDGVILPAPLCDNESVRALITELGLPAVAVAAGRAPEGIPAVSIDDYQAAKAMTRHIVALGHHRIGFIIGNPNQTASARRLQGFRDAMAEAGLDVPEALVAQGFFTYRSGLDAAEHLLDAADPPSAIFASNDDMAAATVAVAHRRGLDVPSDLTVCGFDDTALATTIWPELTTIHQPITDMSRTAVELLVRQVREQRSGKHSAPAHLLLDFTLVRRQSDAAPRKRPRLTPTGRA